jgi:hypothetical protein
VIAPGRRAVIKDGHVVWRPAVDVNRLVAVIGAVALAFLLSRSRVVRAHAKVVAGVA